MRTIHKYQLEITNVQVVNVLRNAIPLCVQLQDGVPTLWVEGNDDARQEIIITMYGTGWEMPPSRDRMYLSTIQVDGFVWHFYQLLTSSRE